MAARRETSTESGTESGGEYKVAKAILLVLLILDIVAGGIYVYVEFFLVRDLEKDLGRSERGLISVYQQTKDLLSVASTIRSNKLEPIDDPGGLIMAIAESYKLHGKVTADRKVVRRWKGTNYEEVTVRINFVMKEGYEFGDIIRFLQSIEHKNPKLLIRDMNFGKREMSDATEGGGQDRWRPTGGALTVRTFRLKT